MKKLCVLFVCLFSLLFVLPAQVAEQQEQLTKQYLSIREELIDLKASTQNIAELSTNIIELSTNIINVSKNLGMRSGTVQTLSQSELEQFQSELIGLSSDLTTINRQYNDCYETLVKTDQKLKTKTKVVWILIIILGTRCISMIVGFILASKGVKTPRWVDILL